LQENKRCFFVNTVYIQASRRWGYCEHHYCMSCVWLSRPAAFLARQSSYQS